MPPRAILESRVNQRHPPVLTGRRCEMTTELAILISLTLIRVIVPIVVILGLGTLLSRWEARHADA